MMNTPRPLARNRERLWLRAKMIQAVRGYFVERDYLEVETPCRIPAPAPECHIDAVPSGDWFLHTSPELCMKRLLAAGYPRIFQICKCFRHGERGNAHLPEFTLLEWYRAGIDYFLLMAECEQLIGSLAVQLGYGDTIPRGHQRIHLAPPWERITLKEAFARYAPLSLEDAIREDRFEETLTRHVEPHLGCTQPTFLYNYPLSMGALARPHHGDPTVAERFELYMAGMELANAFSELTDAEEQRRRFLAEEEQRRGLGKPPYPSPEPFLNDLPHMPAAAGIALGLDRLAMIFADVPGIDEVVAFTPEDL